MKIDDVADGLDTKVSAAEEVEYGDVHEESAYAVERPRFVIPEWVKAQTGAGSVESYIDHPMNFSKSKGMAQILRGLTGMVGELKYALLDVFLGVLQFSKERKAAKALGVVVTETVD